MRSNLVRPRLVQCLVGVVFLFASVACAGSDSGDSGDSGSEDGSQPEVVKVGVILPLTGPLAQEGNQNLAGIEFATKEINENGGIEALGGAKIELIVEDNQHKPEVTIAAANRLVTREDVALIVGSYASSTTVVQAAEHERLQVPLVVPVALSDAITESGFKYTVRVSPKASWAARDAVEYLDDLESQGVPADRIALLYEDGETGQSTAEGWKEALDAAGGRTVVADVSFTTGSATLAPQMSKVERAKPDVVLTLTYSQDAALIAKERVRRQSLATVPFFDSAGAVPDAHFIENVGDAADGWLMAALWDPLIPGQEEISERFEEDAGFVMDQENSSNYQAMIIVKLGLEEAGSLDPEEINQALHDLTIPSGSENLILSHHGSIEFDEQGQNVNGRYVIVQIQDGEHVILSPDESATGNLDTSYYK